MLVGAFASIQHTAHCVHGFNIPKLGCLGIIMKSLIIALSHTIAFVVGYTEVIQCRPHASSRCCVQ